MRYRLGVDLGTTFTAAAVDDGTGAAMLGLGNRALTVPSVVFLASDGTWLFAEAADRRAATEPSRSAREFKRRIGDTVPILVGGQPFSPQALSAKLLGWVISVATERHGSAPAEVVVTYPANWGGYKRELLHQLVTLADVLDVVTCTEPEAAATQYASRARLSTGDKVAVYDLGGGTFDVCVLEKHDTGFAIVGAPDGVEHLGGIDFDEAVFQHVVGMLSDRTGSLDVDDPQVTDALARLRRECVAAKEALSSDVEATIAVTLPGITTSLRMTRSELDGLIASPLRDTLDATARALRSANLTAADLATVVLVGGSSRIPLVSHLLQNEFGVLTAMDTHPKHDIALGAVRYQPAAAGQVAPPAASTVAQWPTRGTTTAEPSPSTPPVPEPVPHPTPPPTERELTPTVSLSAEPSVERPTGPPVWRPSDPHGAAADNLSGTVATYRSGRLTSRPALIGAIVAMVLLVGASAYAITRGIGGDDQAPKSDPSTDPSTSSTPETDLPRGPALSASTVVTGRLGTGGWELWTGDATTGELGDRLTDPSISASEPVISPDRETIIYVRLEDDRQSLWIMGSDGSGNRQLIGTDSDDCPNPDRPGWAPDGTLVLTCQGLDEAFLALTTPSLESTRVLHTAAIVKGPSFSPDSTRVVYWASDDPEARAGTLEVIDIESEERTQLTDPDVSEAAAPVWSPNGDLIAFRRDVVLPSGEVEEDVVTIRPDGSGLVQLTHLPSDDGGPSWSPEGDRLAFVSTRLRARGGGVGKNTHVYTMRASDGADVVKMWPDAPDVREAHPAWGRR